MKKIFLFTLSLTLLFAGRVYARQSVRDSVYRNGLRIGDKVPDILIRHVIGYPTGTFRLSELKGKLILLDFWATWCSSCIAAFPSDYALQKKFGGRFMVLLVNSKSTHDTESSISKFLGRRAAQYQFPCVVSDTLLTGLFPHQTLPHCVLIKDNRVVAITDAEHITSSNIAGLLNGRQRLILEKSDKKFDLSSPLFVNGNGGEQQPFIFRSLLLPRIDNLASVSGFTLTNDHRVSAIRIYNGLLVSIYKFAFREYAGFEPDRTMVRIAGGHNALLDSAARVGFDRVQFTYEANFSPRSRAESLKVLQADLDSYFNLRADSEFKDTLCYVLKLIPGKVLPNCDYSTVAETNIYENSGAPVYFSNLPVSELSGALESIYQVPFINETGLKVNVCLGLQADLHNETALIAALAGQGFVLTKEKRRVSYFVLSKK